MTLDSMTEYIDTHSTYAQKQYGINCAKKESMHKASGETTYAKDKIQLIYPNASHHTASAYNTAHQEGEDLSTFIQKMQKILPKLDIV